VVLGEVAELAPGRATLASGEAITFDYAAICTGSDYPSAFGKASGAPTVADRLAQFHATAAAIRAAPAVVVVGGGPSGVEVAGEIATDFPNTPLMLVHPGPRLLPVLSPSAAAKAQAYLSSLGCRVVLNDRVVGGGGAPPALASGGPLPDGALLLWCTGGKPSSAFMAAHFSHCLAPGGDIMARSLGAWGWLFCFVGGRSLRSGPHPVILPCPVLHQPPHPNPPNPQNPPNTHTHEPRSTSRCASRAPTTFSRSATRRRSPGRPRWRFTRRAMPSWWPPTWGRSPRRASRRGKTPAAAAAAVATSMFLFFFAGGWRAARRGADAHPLPLSPSPAPNNNAQASGLKKWKVNMGFKMMMVSIGRRKGIAQMGGGADGGGCILDGCFPVNAKAKNFGMILKMVNKAFGVKA